LRRLSRLILFALVVMPLAVAAQSAPRVVGQIDDNSLEVLNGNLHPLANPANDYGEVSSDLQLNRMLMVLRRDPAVEADLRKLLADQQDPASPLFHQWLAPQQFQERFAPAESDRQIVSEWLTAHGFTVTRIAAAGSVIEFNGTAAQVREAFHTPIHSYFSAGRWHYANAENPAIPRALTPLVAGIDTLHNFEKRSNAQVLGSASRISGSSAWTPNFTYSSANSPPRHFLAPSDFSKIYNATALYQAGIDGRGQSIAIVGRSNINLSDIEIFRIAFGLPMNNPTIIVDGPDPGNLFWGEEAEADLDVEWAGAIAPAANIKFVVSSSTNTTDGVDLSAIYIVDNNLAPVMSTSFGMCESSLGASEAAFWNNLWEQAAAQGITAIVSSGDSGAAGCDFSFGTARHGKGVNGLASTAFNVAVGGTQFNENGRTNYWAPTNGSDQSSAQGYIPEVVWNESCSDPSLCGGIFLESSGGGSSTLYSKPSWQNAPGVPNDGQRDVPDISFNAAGNHDGYLLCQDGICTTDSTGMLTNAEVVGGTSAGAPAFAGVMALVNQVTGSRQGQANYHLYPLAASQNVANCNSDAPQPTCIFHDITQGNNSVPGLQGYNAGPGYDLATGLGSINIANLVNGWTSVGFNPTTTTLQLSANVGVHGQPLTVNVGVSSATGGTPTGSVSLVASGGPLSDVFTLGPGGNVSANISDLPGGTYSLIASYSGDSTYAASTSSAQTLTIQPESSTTSFSILGFKSGNLVPVVSTTYGDYLYFQSAVIGTSGKGTATGKVSFSDSINGTTASLGSTNLNSKGSLLSLNTSLLAIGNHTISSTYSGDPSFTSSVSSPVTIAVDKGITATSLWTPSGALPNQPTSLWAYVFPSGSGQPTGSVQFYAGANTIGGPIPLQGYYAVLITSQLPSGSNSITASYSGDTNFNGSSSPAQTVVVGYPDFQLGINPGSLVVTPAKPGQATLLLSPSSVLGFFGNVSLSCSGLPAGASCSFQPATLQLNGVTVTTAIVTISSSAGSAASARLSVPIKKYGRPLFSLALVGFVMIFLPRGRKKGLRIVLFCGYLAACLAGCGGGSSSKSSNSVTTPLTPLGSATVVTITASGTASNAPSGTAPVSHTVSMAVAFQ
jgi:hypothetical protein